MFYLMMHSTFLLLLDKWLSTIEMSYSFILAAKDILYAPSHRQDSTYDGPVYTSRGALAGTRNSSVGPPGETDTTTHCALSGHSTTKLTTIESNLLLQQVMFYFITTEDR